MLRALKRLGPQGPADRGEQRGEPQLGHMSPWEFRRISAVSSSVSSTSAVCSQDELREALPWARSTVVRGKAVRREAGGPQCRAEHADGGPCRSPKQNLCRPASPDFCFSPLVVQRVKNPPAMWETWV